MDCSSFSLPVTIIINYGSVDYFYFNLFFQSVIILFILIFIVGFLF